MLWALTAIIILATISIFWSALFTLYTAFMDEVISCAVAVAKHFQANLKKVDVTGNL